MTGDREHTSDPVDVRVMAELRAAGRPCTADELAARLGFTVPTTKRGLGKLVRDHLARKAGGGLFVATTRRSQAARGRTRESGRIPASASPAGDGPRPRRAIPAPPAPGPGGPDDAAPSGPES